MTVFDVSDTSAALEKMSFPPAVIENLVASACEQIDDDVLAERLRGDRLFRDRVHVMAQFILIAVTCAQLFASDDDFADALTNSPFSAGDRQARQIGLQIFQGALTFGRLPDAAIDDKVFDQRSEKVRQSI